MFRKRVNKSTIKTAALEALVPSELVQHLATNRARLITYEQVRSEIQAYTETRRSQFAFMTVAAKSTSDPMEVDSFCKGGKKGKKGDGRSKPESESESEQGRCLLALWEERPPEHGVLVEPKQSAWLRRRPKQRRERKTEERHRLKSRLFGTGRTSCRGGTTAATGSCELSGLGVDWNSDPITAP